MLSRVQGATKFDNLAKVRFFFVIFGGGRLGGCVCVVAGRGIAEVGLKCGDCVVDVYGEHWMVY